MILIIVDRRYNKLQFLPTLRVLRSRGHQFEVYSTSKVVEEEKGTKTIAITGTIADIDPERFEALMFISGHPADTKGYWKDERVRNIVLTFQDKPCAAICASVPSLRHIAQGYRVSVYSMQATRELLEMAGAELTGLIMTVDRNLVTCESELFAESWANVFCDVLEGKPVNLELKPVGELRYARPRKPIKGLHDRRETP